MTPSPSPILMNKDSTHKSQKIGLQPEGPQWILAPAPSRAQGVIRTVRRQRPSPINLQHRSLHTDHLQYPFGPQIPLRIGRRPACSTVAPAKEQSQPQPQPQPNPTSPGPVPGFLDSTFRSYTDRIQAELSQLQRACTKVMSRERQERVKWQAHCATFKQERDDARKRVAVMLRERESLRSVEAVLNADNGEGQPRPAARVFSHRVSDGCRAVSTSPEEDLEENPTDESDSLPGEGEQEEDGVCTLLYPLSSDCTTPPIVRLFPLQLLPCRRSKGKGKAKSTSPMPRPSSSPSSVTKSRLTVRALRSQAPSSSRHFSGGSHELPPPLSPRSEPGDFKPGPLTLTSASTTPVLVQGSLSGEAAIAEDGSKLPLLPTPPCDGVHLDIMYGQKDGKLVCRVCLVTQSSKSATPSSPVVSSFPVDTKWEDLRDHCVKEHAQECEEIAQLGPPQLEWLRRRIFVSRT